MMKIIFFLAVINICLIGISSAENIIGIIGDSELRYKAASIDPQKSKSYRIDPFSDLICVTEIYPDKVNQPVYSSEIYLGKQMIYKRDYKGKGFGCVSYFVKIPSAIEHTGIIKIKNTGKDNLLIYKIISVNSNELSHIEKNDEFGLFGLLSSYNGEESEKKWIEQLAEGLPQAKNIYLGFSTEIPYAQWNDESIKSQLARHIQYAKQFNLHYFPSLVSWWAATPLGIPDGEGGHFGDIKYQQICWSLDDNEEDSTELKQLLGDRWNVHYGLSKPNQWSNVPWLTMNSTALNSYRYNKIDHVMRYMMAMIDESGIEFEGIYLENEPRYWDTACEAGNPKRDWNECWADFNSFVINDAKKDGIDIDPSDGLDYNERMWLHRNVAKYNQGIVDQANATLKSIGKTDQIDIYTHSLQLMGFPGDEIGHPMSEWAYVNGASIGLEGIWVKLSDFDRVREWGQWANLNREEGDGRIIEEHLWDLRCSYARGGKLYNSYNWNTIGAQRVFNYMNDFLNGITSAQIESPDMKMENDLNLSFILNPDLQAINRIKLTVMADKKMSGNIGLSVKDKNNYVIGYSVSIAKLQSGSNDIEFIFSEPFELSQGERGYLSLSVGRKDSDSIEMKNAKFYLDLRRERNQSLFIINNAKK